MSTQKSLPDDTEDVKPWVAVTQKVELDDSTAGCSSPALDNKLIYNPACWTVMLEYLYTWHPFWEVNEGSDEFILFRSNTAVKTWISLSWSSRAPMDFNKQASRVLKQCQDYHDTIVKQLRRIKEAVRTSAKFEDLHKYMCPPAIQVLIDSIEENFDKFMENYQDAVNKSKSGKTLTIVETSIINMVNGILEENCPLPRQKLAALLCPKLDKVTETFRKALRGKGSLLNVYLKSKVSDQKFIINCYNYKPLDEKFKKSFKTERKITGSYSYFTNKHFEANKLFFELKNQYPDLIKCNLGECLDDYAISDSDTRFLMEQSKTSLSTYWLQEMIKLLRQHVPELEDVERSVVDQAEFALQRLRKECTLKTISDEMNGVLNSQVFKDQFMKDLATSIQITKKVEKYGAVSYQESINHAIGNGPSPAQAALEVANTTEAQDAEKENESNADKRNDPTEKSKNLDESQKTPAKTTEAVETSTQKEGTEEVNRRSLPVKYKVMNADIIVPLMVDNKYLLLPLLEAREKYYELLKTQIPQLVEPESGEDVESDAATRSSSVKSIELNSSNNKSRSLSHSPEIFTGKTKEKESGRKEAKHDKNKSVAKKDSRFAKSFRYVLEAVKQELYSDSDDSSCYEYKRKSRKRSHGYSLSQKKKYRKSGSKNRSKEYSDSSSH